MRELDKLFVSLNRSNFRTQFHLSAAENGYLEEKRLPVILEHARKFITERLAPPQPANDGKQTPLRGHPVFVAQHATATCCRRCLSKWHGISQGIPLSDQQITYVVEVLERWLQSEIAEHSPEIFPRQATLFPE